MWSLLYTSPPASKKILRLLMLYSHSSEAVKHLKRGSRVSGNHTLKRGNLRLSTLTAVLLEVVGWIRLLVSCQGHAFCSRRGCGCSLGSLTGKPSKFPRPVAALPGSPELSFMHFFGRLSWDRCSAASCLLWGRSVPWLHLFAMDVGEKRPWGLSI